MSRGVIGLVVLLGGCDYVWNLQQFADAQTDTRPADAAPAIDAPVRDGTTASVPMFVQPASAAKTGVPALSAAFTSPVMAGDLIVVFVGWTSGASSPAMTDSAGDPVQPVGAPLTNSTLNQAVYFIQTVATSSTLTITATFGAMTQPSGIDIRALDYRNVTASMLAGTIAQGSGNIFSIGPVTTSQPNEMLVAGVLTGAPAVSQVGSWNTRIGGAASSIAADFLAPTPGGYTVHFTQTTNTIYVEQLVSMRSL